MKKGLLVWVALASLAGCGGSSNGRISLTWNVTIDGADATCDSVGASFVEVVATDVDSFHTTFPCSAFSGTIGGLPPGDYDVDVILEDSAHVEINSTGTTNTVPVDSGRTTDAGDFVVPFVFNVVRFTVHIGSSAVTGGNCAETSVNGAGIVQQEFDLFSGSSTQCVAADITNEGDTPATASTCQPFVCQETDVVHVIHGLRQGNYTLDVHGLKGATGADTADCYFDSMDFTLGSNDVNLGTLFAPFNPATGDDAICNATKPQE